MRKDEAKEEKGLSPLKRHSTRWDTGRVSRGEYNANCIDRLKKALKTSEFENRRSPS